MDIKKFQIKKSKRNKKFRAYIIGKNGEQLFWSEQYDSLTNAEHVIELVDPEHEIPVEIIDGK